MLKKIARRLSSYPAAKRVLKYTFQAVMFLFHYHRTRVRCRFAVVKQSEGSDCFFGYYDKSPESPDGKYLVWHRLISSAGKKQEAEICLKNLASGEIRVIGRTRAVNIQMGARLQWMGNDRLIYNVYQQETDSYGSVIYHLADGKEQMLDFPVFDVCGDRFITLDFKQLASCGSEYGYFAHQSAPDLLPSIRLGSLSSGDSRILISLSHLENIIQLPADASHIHFNHLMFSPSGNRFLFFLRFHTPRGRLEYLFMHDFQTSESKLLNAEMTSHCCWMDEQNLAGYLSHGQKPGFYQVDTGNLHFQQLFSDSVIGDGHPSFRNGVLLFDSYPDYSRMQHLYVSGNNRLLLAGSFYTPLIFDEYYRCDLHPRFGSDGKKIYFDSLHSGRRHLYSLELNAHE